MVIIPESVEEIGDYAFNKCSGFGGTLTFPSTLKSIGNASISTIVQDFTGDLVIPEGVETIGTHAFNKCGGFDGTLTITIYVKKYRSNCFSVLFWSKRKFNYTRGN